MQNVRMLAALAVLSVAACSPGGGAGAGEGGGLTEAQCQAIVDKSRSLSGMPADMFADAAAQTVQQCTQSTKVSQKDYDCAMAASSMEAFQDCRIDVVN